MPSAFILAPGANAIETADNVKKILADAKESLPGGHGLRRDPRYHLPIKASMEEIVHTLFEAVILVLIVVYIFLQSFRATLIPMLTVPVSLLGAFIMFPALGFSVNVLTMFGLVLAIGIVVDDAIVVVEAVQHHIEHGKDPVEATRIAMKEVSGPVVAIGLVLCAVFVPVAFMGGVTGQLVQTIRSHHRRGGGVLGDQRADAQPGVVGDAVAQADAREAARSPKFFKWFNTMFDNLSNQLRQHRRRHLPQGARSMMLLVVVVAGIWLIGKFVPGGFIPDEDKGYLFVAVQLPEGASLQRSDEILKQVEEIVGSTKGVRSAVGMAGYNILNSLNFPNSAMMFIGLEPWEERKSPALHASALAREWTKKFAAIPGARAFAFGPPPLPGYGNVSGFTHAIAGPLRRQHRATGRLRQATHRRGLQAPGDRPHQHHLQSGHAAGEGRTRPREGAHARRDGGQRVRDAADLPERTLRERLRPLWPRL